jgi:thiazole/oxazole-forming peptide maturase SagD family component
MTRRVVFAMRGAGEPRVALAAGEVTGIEGLVAGPLGSQHISGAGITREEALQKVLAESIERYCLLRATRSGRFRAVHASLHRMARYSRVLAPEPLQPFTAAQFAQPGFPFAPVDADTTIGWVAGLSPDSGALCWAPAQAALPGYGVPPGEPRYAFGVSTGTAAHTQPELALRAALLEVIQADAAMGTWYGGTLPMRLRLGESPQTQTVEQLIDRHTPRLGPAVRFYWLPATDLPGIAVACVVERAGLPRFAVGLGCDLRLGPALYGAWLESMAVARLAAVTALRFAERGEAVPGPDGIYDLDANVARYAVVDEDVIRARFGDEPAVSPGDLPPDLALGAADGVRYLVNELERAGKRLLYLDLTDVEARALGFAVARVWSPDLLALSLPGAPPVLHPRFHANGGITNTAPHPYP